MRGLWRCPRCGRRFANRHQWHSCGDRSLTELLDGASDIAVGIYDRIEAALGAAGELRVHPQKTRIAFISRMTFASVALARRWVDLAFIVEGVVDDPRIRRIELFGPTSFGHHVRLSSPRDVDGDIESWLRRARRRGDQTTLDPQAHVEPVVGGPLEILRVPLRSTVVRGDGELGLAVPRYAAEAFAAHPVVVARIAGAHHCGSVLPDGGRGLLVLDGGVGALGLGEGDPVDVFLSADL